MNVTVVHQQWSLVLTMNEVRMNMKVVGHIPKLMAVWVTKFLNRPTNIGKVIIKGKRINIGAGYGWFGNSLCV